QLEQEGEIDVLGVVDRMVEKWDKGEALHITVRTLYDINKHAVARTLEAVCRRALVQFELRANHRRRYYSLYEGTCRPGQQRYIRHVYVQSPVVLKTQNGEGAPIGTGELFCPREGEGRVRVVVTTGVPAIGLTVTMQMFIMDWAEEQAYQHFQFVFALPGRDLHLVRNSAQTFLEFLASFYPEAKHAEFLSSENCSVLFVIDALELCRQPLDFHNNQSVTEITASAPADALLTSLIEGHLLPHACIWITSHRSTARKIPAACVSRFTEIKGFGNEEKDEYFTKRTKDPTLGRRVLERVKESPVLYDACYLPLFSWIMSFVYERRLQSRGFLEQTPALTTFYVQYIIVLTNRKIERYVGTGLDASRWKDPDRDYLMKTGELALKMLQEGTDIFYEDSVSRLALDVHEVTHRGGISYETDEPARDKGRSFRFVHHSVQKFMAALYVYVNFRTTGENVLERQRGRVKAERPVSELFKPAIDRTLGRADGHMDLFLHFLLGLASRGTEMHLRGHLLPQYHPEPKGVEETLKHARKRIAENTGSARCRNLELCLAELEE
ncbi:NLR family CARD domain-containing protein 3-like isoform X2, partial [Silurus asotus]